jgi:hypothetical protein
MIYIAGPCSCPEERDAGSPFQHFFLDVMVWFSSHSAIPTLANAFNTGASFLELGVSATQVVDALRYCADFPAIAKQHRPWGAMRCAWFSVSLRYGSSVILDTSTAWLLETMLFTFHKTCPDLALLIGTDPASWGSQTLPSVLRRLESVRRRSVDGSEASIDFDTAPALDAHLRSRRPVLLQLIDEYPDVAERIRVALSNKPIESGLMPILKISSTFIDAGGSDSQTFASAAGNVKSGASYIGIRKDVMAFKLNGGSPVEWTCYARC